MKWPLPSPASSEDDRYKYDQLLIEAEQGKDTGKGIVGKPAERCLLCDHDGLLPKIFSIALYPFVLQTWHEATAQALS